MWHDSLVVGELAYLPLHKSDKTSELLSEHGQLFILSARPLSIHVINGPDMISNPIITKAPQC